MVPTKGIHHITAVADDPQQNLDFYAGTLGLRLVKKTVNFDDPSTYHLYYGDEDGSPGSVLTFFPYRNFAQGHPDTGQVVAVSFSVPEASASFWTGYLSDAGIDYVDPFERFGREVIGLQGPDGLHLELVFDPEAGGATGWSNGTIPSEHSIRGFYGAALAEASYEGTAHLLEYLLGFEPGEQREGRYRFSSEARYGSVIEIIETDELSGKPGKGTVHHIAFRGKHDKHQKQFRRALLEEGYHVTEVKDRQYFKSIYFYEPGGILFEVATDGPGFDIDEPVEELGSQLKLPPWLEDKRELIESDLPVLSPEA